MKSFKSHRKETAGKQELRWAHITNTDGAVCSLLTENNAELLSTEF